MKASSFIMAAALFSSSVFAMRVVECPPMPLGTPLIQSTTNSKGQICWFVNDNLASTPGRFFLDCLPNKPLPSAITEDATLARIDDSFFVSGETYILCYYPTTTTATFTTGELWIRLVGTFTQTGPITFTEVPSGTRPPSVVLPEKQITEKLSSNQGNNVTCE